MQTLNHEVLYKIWEQIKNSVYDQSHPLINPQLREQARLQVWAWVNNATDGIRSQVALQVETKLKTTGKVI